jgi:ferric-dicitrate binding protein FerR (iron transport regulator)
MSPDVQLELQRLLSALCDGALSEAQQARLEQLLNADPECRLQYLEYLDMHARLLTHPRLCEAAAPVPDEQPFLAELADELDPAAEASPPLPGARPLVSGRRRGWQVFRYGAVAAATLAASLLVQFFWWHPSGSDGKFLNGESDYVATLTQTADCSWEGRHEMLRPGSRLPAGSLRLRKGVAQIRFDTGPELVIEGPAELQLDSGTAATLSLGKAVFRTDETAPPFELHTPSATLTDFGTEFALAVSPEGEEVHVIEGEVQRVPRAGGEGEHLKAGEARRSEPSAFASQPTAFEPGRFVRRLTAPDQQGPDHAAGLLAYEGFDYHDADALVTNKANGGRGWASPWTPTFPGAPDREKNLALNVKDGLTRPAAAVPAAGGRFEASGLAIYYRRLAVPVSLDQEGVYYLSFLFRRQGPPGPPSNVLSVILRADEDFSKRRDLSKRLTIGVSGSNQIFTHLGRACSRTSLPLANGTTYLLVAKIVAGSSSRQQVFVRAYGPREPIGAEEPTSWTVVSPPFKSDLTLEWLGVHVNGMNRQMIDEIRLGTDWPAVTAPWRGAAEADREGKP